MRYLTAGDVLRMHAREIGVKEPIHDFGLLESAVLRPQASSFGSDAYPTIHEKAAALMHSLVQNHPFADGNKRTALIAVGAFYNLNGLDIAADPGVVMDLALDVAQGSLEVPEIADRLARMVQPLPLPE